MKKLVVALAFVAFIVTNVSSQESKMWVGGSLTLTSQDFGATSSSSFGIRPEFGYNINERFAVGGRIGYTVNSITNVDGDKQSQTAFSLVPFARYTVFTIGNAQIFGQAELPLTFYGGTNYDGSSMPSSNSMGIVARPGLAYFFNEKWGINMLMPSFFSFVNSSNNTSTFRLGINDGYTIQGYLLDTQIGFVYRF
jgi:hypothetical protein